MYDKGGLAAYAALAPSSQCYEAPRMADLLTDQFSSAYPWHGIGEVGMEVANAALKHGPYQSTID